MWTQVLLMGLDISSTYSSSYRASQDVKGVYAAIRAHKWNPLLEKIVAILEGTTCPPSICLVDLICSFSDRYRQRTIELVSRAYSNLKLADLAVFLGASVDEATKCTLMSFSRMPSFANPSSLASCSIE